MDNHGSRGNGNKFQSSKNHTKTYRNNSGRSVRISIDFRRIRIISSTLLISFQHDDEMHSERDRNDDYYGKKGKKPDPGYYQEYQPNKQQQQQKSDKRYDRSYDNRPSRQGSEPRGAGNFSNQDQMKSGYVNADRNRDTRSSEPGGNHYKPPSGPRISNSAFQRLPLNIDSLPPRLKKKYLLEAGLSEDLVDKPISEMAQQSYSNTLPTGRGGRNNNRYDYHQQGNYQNSYRNQNSYHNDFEHRSLTPPLSKASRLQQHQQPPPPQKPPTPQRYDWKVNDAPRYEDTSPGKKEDPNFDWSEDVLNSQSLPHDVNTAANVQQKYSEGGHRHKHRSRRNRR